MRAITLLLTFTISLITYGQQGMIQELEMSKKDSLRLRQVPELKVKPSFLHNRAPLPSSVDNSIYPYWRGIFWQSGCSCGQASSEGYVFTYEINRKRDLDATLDENRYPYSFTYNFLNIGNTVCGASWLESQDIIREAGIPSLPVNGGVMTDGSMRRWLDGYDKYYSAMQNRINNVYGIHVGSPEGLEILKNWLHNHLENSFYGGLAFFYANHVNYPEVIPEGTPEAGKHIITGFSNTSHAMTIVGYNDEVRFDYNNDGQYTNDIDITGDGIVDMRDWEIGAIKIANTYSGSVSGGPINWADQGFCYVMYRVLAYHNAQGGLWDKRAYVSDVKASYSPLLTAKVNLTYDSRDKIKVMAGVSTDLSATFPEHIEEFPHFRFQGDALYMQGGDEETDKTIEFGLDLSELLNYVDSNQAAKYFLYIKEDDEDNEGTGQVNSFSIIDYTNGENEWVSPQSNVAIVDNGNTLLSVESTTNYSDVKIVNDTIPKAELNNPYLAQLTIEGGTAPYRWFPFFDYKITTLPHAFTPITGVNVSGGYSNVNLDFEFPFYGEKYNSGTVSEYGALMFEFEDANVPYDRDYSILMRYFKSIAPFYGYSSDANIRYQGNADSASVYWDATFDNQSVEYMITLFPDGTIYIDYGDGTTPDDPEWSAGVTKGDQISYQEFDFSGKNFPANTRIILEPRPFPTGLDIDNTGLIFGTQTEEFEGDSIFVKVVDNNWLTSVKGFLFTERGLLFSNYQIETPNDSILEYGETAQISFDLSNIGESSVNNINLKLHTYDSLYTLVDSLDFLSTLSLGNVHTFNQAFEFDVANVIPDNSPITFVLEAEADEISAFDTISFIVRAPLLELVNTEFIDGEDYILDPGETGDLVVTYKNVGGSAATNLTATYAPLDTYITINSISNDTKAELLPDSTWAVTLNITADGSTPEGSVSDLDSDIDGDKSYHSDNDIYVGIGLTIENWESGNTEQFPWGASGNADWFIDNTTMHEGNYALKSGEITHNEETVLSLVGTVATAGNLSFYKKVSSESNYDFLRFYIDSVQAGEWSGETDWTQHTFSLTAGLHSFEWKYEKDQSVSSGEDAAWLDYIVFPAIDFSDPEIETSMSAFEKTMYISETDTDTIVITNVGGGLLSYTATIDNASLNSNTPPSTNNARSVAGSSLTSNTTEIVTGSPITIELSLYNGSPDNEYIEGLTLSFPLGVSLDSASHFVGGSGGVMTWDATHGNGSNVSWFGEQDDGWGVLHSGETAVAKLYLSIDEAIQNSVIIQYQIEGEVYADAPHTITDFLVFTNNGVNDTWLTLSQPSANITANQNSELFLDFNTYSIPEGTYNCHITVNSNINSVDIPVTLNVMGYVQIDEYTNGINVFPNPIEDVFIIELDSSSESRVEIFDASGKLVSSSLYKTSGIRINAGHYEKGLYLIVVHQDNKRFKKQIVIAP